MLRLSKRHGRCAKMPWPDSPPAKECFSPTRKKKSRDSSRKDACWVGALPGDEVFCVWSTMAFDAFLDLREANAEQLHHGWQATQQAELIGGVVKLGCEG